MPAVTAIVNEGEALGVVGGAVASLPVGASSPSAPTTQAGTAYTITATDASDVIRFTNAAAVTVTIPTDVTEDLPDGFEVVLYAEGAAGLTLSTTGITLTGSSPNKSVAQNEALFLKKTATADTWIVLGGTSA